MRYLLILEYAVFYLLILSVLKPNKMTQIKTNFNLINCVLLCIYVTSVWFRFYKIWFCLNLFIGRVKLRSTDIRLLFNKVWIDLTNRFLQVQPKLKNISTIWYFWDILVKQLLVGLLSSKTKFDELFNPVFSDVRKLVRFNLHCSIVY